MTETTQPSRWHRFVDTLAAPPTNIRPGHRYWGLAFALVLLASQGTLMALDADSAKYAYGLVVPIGLVLSNLTSRFVWPRRATIALRLAHWTWLVFACAYLGWLFLHR
jgi:hypothetical protein